MGARRRRITSRTHGRRTQLLTAALAVLATGFVSRAAQLQIVQAERWQTQAWDQTTETVEIPAARGGIYDRNGKALALSRQEYRAFFAPAQSSDRKRHVQTIGTILDLSRRLTSRLTSRSTGWIPIRQVSSGEKEALAQAVGGAVEFEPVAARVYPEGDLARALLGSVSAEGEGRSGLELVLDTLLRGSPGELVGRRDARGELYPIPARPQRPARSGRDVFLTIDADLQAIAEAALEAGLKQTGSTGGDVVMADPRTGELLAVASRREGSEGTVPAFTSPYEPGSTVKPFLLATLLAEQLADLDERVFAEDGEYRTAHRVIRDVHPYDTLTVAEVIQFSSNIGAAKLSDRLDRGMQYGYLRDFGFGTSTGIDFPGESPGLLRRPDRWSALSQASLAIGYELMTTSLQLVAAYGTLASGGYLLEPVLVRGIRGGVDQQSWEFETTPIRRVIDARTAERVSRVLAAVVEEGGTGEEASLATLQVAGKTGTARIATGGGYGDRRYAASFVGFTPAHDPQLVILVKLEDPQGSVYGGRTAAPVTRAVVQAILATRGRGLIQTELADHRSGTLDWAPAAELESPFRFANVEAVEASSEERDLLLPDLRGLEVRVAAARLHTLGLNVELLGSGRVVRQEPSAGARVVRGATVLLR
jgi:cell division protein FtsI (penicillin-binding protein 3)